MCEGRISLEEAKMLMADLTARKNAKQPKLTSKQWLNQHKVCSLCKFQATCHHNPVQWVQEWADDEAGEFHPRVNRSLTTGVVVPRWFLVWYNRPLQKALKAWL